MFQQIHSIRSNTCYAHALSHALNISYDRAIFECRKYLMGKGEGTLRPLYFEEIAEVANKIGKKNYRTWVGRGKTLKRFLSENNSGTFIVCSSEHAMAVKNGIVYDFKKRMNFKIIEFILIG